MPECDKQSRPKLAEKPRHNSLLKIKKTTTATMPRRVSFSVFSALENELFYICCEALKSHLLKF